MNDVVKPNTMISYSTLVDDVAKTISKHLADDVRFINVSKDISALDIPDAFKPDTAVSVYNNAPGGTGNRNKYVNNANKLLTFSVTSSDANTYLSAIDASAIRLSLSSFLYDNMQLCGNIASADQFLRLAYTNATKYLSKKIVKLQSPIADGTYFSYCDKDQVQRDLTNDISASLSCINDYLTDISRIHFLQYTKTATKL